VHCRLTQQPFPNREVSVNLSSNNPASWASWQTTASTQDGFASPEAAIMYRSFC
jgi:hypothetical protein